MSRFFVKSTPTTSQKMPHGGSLEPIFFQEYTEEEEAEHTRLLIYMLCIHRIWHKVLSSANFTRWIRLWLTSNPATLGLPPHCRHSAHHLGQPQPGGANYKPCGLWKPLLKMWDKSDRAVKCVFKVCHSLYIRLRSLHAA